MRSKNGSQSVMLTTDRVWGFPKETSEIRGRMHHPKDSSVS